jgi:hypothetical protein
MKHKYKINIDPPVPSDAQIDRHKDFGRTLAAYHNLTQPIYRKPLYKNPKAFMGLVLIFTIAALVFWAVEDEEKDKAKEKELLELPLEVKMAQENSFLKAPARGIAVQSEGFDIVGTNAQKITLTDGSTLTIPADAFELPSDMRPEDVYLQVTQMHSIAEVIAMGLPMQTDGKLIDPATILEIRAFIPHAIGSRKEVALASNAKITVEVPVAANALQARQLFTLDPKTHAWRSAAAAPIQPHPKKSNRVSIDPNDGFGVVEYDAQGQVIPKPKANTPKGEQPIQVLQFDLAQLGILCLGELQAQPIGSVAYKARFTDPARQPLRLLTLYGIAKGRNTVEFLWPKSADFAFDLHLAPGQNVSYVGFLPDGRLATLRNIGAMPETQAVQVLQMQVSAAPVKDLPELTQLIDSLTGL